MKEEQEGRKSWQIGSMVVVVGKGAAAVARELSHLGYQLLWIKEETMRVG